MDQGRHEGDAERLRRAAEAVAALERDLTAAENETER